MNFKPCKTFCLCSLAIATLAAETPAVIVATTASAPNGIAPIGVGATTSKLLFSEPYCATTGQTRGVYSVSNVAPPPATITQLFTLPENGCSENYFMISPGYGGFPAGAVYATDAAGTSTSAVYKDGSLFINGLPNSNPSFAGITFDTVGTFNLAMIVTGQSIAGGFNSAGALLFTYPTPSGFFFESATVAPLANSACPGCLYLTATSTTVGDPGAIFTIQPGSPSGTIPTLVTRTPEPEPESILFVPTQLCTLNGTNYSYFVSAFTTTGELFGSQSTHGALLAFSNTQLAPYAGKFLVPFESGLISTFNGATFTSTFFNGRLIDQLEGATIIACPPAGGCPATQGYWKHHAFPPSMFTGGTVVIGGVAYTAAQLVDILNTPPQGGDAGLILMHQLIAALANIAAGAQNVGVVENGVNVNLAIAEAESLLKSGLPQPGFPGTNPAGVTFPINFNASSNNFVASSTALGGYLVTLSNVLDAYNSAVGLNCSEASGLTN